MQDKKYFGVMLDMSRNGVMQADEVCRFAKTVKSFGYNTLMLYTEETYEVENEPYFGHYRGRYTQAELKQIVDYCENIGIEVIPCIQTLAHLESLFHWRHYHPIYDVEEVLLVGHERTYELIENMFKTLRKCMKTDRIHIGMDEAHMLGLGRYLQQNGFESRFDILQKHLVRVLEIAQKYNFKPMMWSDMYFRLANQGAYYGKDIQIPDEVIAKQPKEVGLVYWHYYGMDEELYRAMMKTHKKFDCEVWYAGGSRSSDGFASGNRFSIPALQCAMQACKKEGIDNVLITCWGDGGKECSFWTQLPTLYAVRRFYDGEENLDSIAKEFESLTGESFAAMLDFDLPDRVAGNEVRKNPCKNMFYNDVFLGVLDSIVADGVCEEYARHAAVLRGHAKNSRFAYIFHSMAKLCDFLAVKYDLGVRLRSAYQSGDKKQLGRLAKDIKKAETRLAIFFEAFRTVWYKENKPHGFDIQEQRFGGLMHRLKCCRLRVQAYVKGKCESIPELEEQVLDYYGNGHEFNKEQLLYNAWDYITSVNRYR